MPLSTISGICLISFLVPANTLLITCNYLDRYLSYVTVERKNLQMVGCAAFILACFWSENLVLQFTDLIYLSDKSFTEKDFSLTIYDMFMKLNGCFYINTCYEIIDQNNYLEYPKMLVKWVNILMMITQQNHRLFTLNQKALLFNVLYIIDILDELLTGKLKVLCLISSK